MKKFTLFSLFVLIIAFLFPDFTYSQSNASLHMTRKGKEYFYKVQTGGFEVITGIPMASLRCMRCHPGKLANNTPIDTATYQPSCNDCHNFAIGNAVPDTICLRCHSRQKVERNFYTDKHKSAGFSCITCHTKEDLHLDATNHNTMFDTTLSKTCQTVGCHNVIPITPNNQLAHSTHNATVECSACHARAEVTCYNCHFETELWSGMRGFKRPIGQLRDFIMLGRLPKKENKIGLVNYQSLTYQGQSFMGYGPYYSHTIMTKDSTRACSGCHNNAIINELNTTGQIYVAKWDSTLTPKRIVHKTGVIPIPPNYSTVFKFDFANYVGRVDTNYTNPAQWVFLKSGLNGHQMLSQYVLPLTASQMTKLGSQVGITPIGNEIPNKFDVKQNYPNPFNPTTTIRFSVPKATNVTLKVFNSLGREVSAILLNSYVTAGNYEVEFVGANLTSGVYFYKFTAQDFSKTMKMMLLK